jgi:hypothetical protein
MQRNQSTDYFEVNEPVARQIAAWPWDHHARRYPGFGQSPGQSIPAGLPASGWPRRGLSEDLVLRLYVVGTMGVAAGLLYPALFLVLLSPRVALWGAVVLWDPASDDASGSPSSRRRKSRSSRFFRGAAGGGHARSAARPAVGHGDADPADPAWRPPAVLLVWLWLDARWPWRRLAIFGVTLVAGCALAVGPWENMGAPEGWAAGFD